MSTNTKLAEALRDAAPEIAESNEAESGRHNGLRHGVHSDLLLRDRAAAALAGVSGGSLADALWNSDEVMSLNAELDLTMDQLTRLARALLAATPQPAPAPPAREPGCDLGCSPEHARVVRLDKAQAAPEAQQPAGRASVDDWERELSAVMPADFKDWWQNSRREWPAVAAEVIKSLRLDRDAGWEVAALAQRREPLTDEQIAEGRYRTWAAEPDDAPEAWSFLRGARWAEKHFGIGATTGEQQ